MRNRIAAGNREVEEVHEFAVATTRYLPPDIIAVIGAAGMSCIEGVYARSCGPTLIEISPSNAGHSHPLGKSSAQRSPEDLG